MGEKKADLDADLDGLLAVMARTGDAMVAVSAEGRIVAWSDPTASLLGWTAEEAVGRACCDVLDWQDRHGNLICGPECPVGECARRDQMVANQEVIAHSRSGRALWLSVSTVVLPPRFRPGCQLVHYLREAALPVPLERVFLQGRQQEVAGAGARPPQFTRREAEVLRLMGDGLETPEIARQLGISRTTVRNHVQHILAKLNVHSRSAAVVASLRAGPERLR